MAATSGAGDGALDDGVGRGGKAGSVRLLVLDSLPNPPTRSGVSPMSRLGGAETWFS